MNEFWMKNKWTLISTATYFTIVLIFGELNRYNMCILLSSIFAIPLLHNLKIDSDSVIWNILSGFIFGFLITPFSFSSIKGEEIHSVLSFTYHSQILYWFLLFFLNLCYSVHRNSYIFRKKSEGIVENRDEKIYKILNPVKKRFFQ